MSIIVVEASAFNSAEVEDIDADRIAASTKPIIPIGRKEVMYVMNIKFVSLVSADEFTSLIISTAFSLTNDASSWFWMRASVFSFM